MDVWRFKFCGISGASWLRLPSSRAPLPFALSYICESICQYICTLRSGLTHAWDWIDCAGGGSRVAERSRRSSVPTFRSLSSFSIHLFFIPLSPFPSPSLWCSFLFSIHVSTPSSSKGVSGGLFFKSQPWNFIPRVPREGRGPSRLREITENPRAFCKGNPRALFIHGMKRLERTRKHRKLDKFHPTGANPVEVLYLKREDLCLSFCFTYNV